MEAKNVGETLVRIVNEIPDKTAMVFEGRRFSYRDLYNRVNSLGNGLLRLGIGRQDRVAILSFNSSAYIEIYFALGKIGAAAVPLNFLLSPRELKFVLEHSEACAFIYSQDFSQVVDSLRPELKEVKLYVYIGEDTPQGTINFEELIASSPDHEPEVEVTEEDIFSILYTAGTTGEPKGAVRKHRNVLAQHEALLDRASEMSEDEVYLATPPMFHIAGGECVMSIIIGGGTIVPLKRFDPVEVLKTIEKERVTSSFFVPMMSFVLLNHPDFKKYNLSSLRSWTSASAPLPAETKKQIMALGVQLSDGYGMTETGSLTMATAEDMERKPGSVGKPLCNMEVRLIDNDWNEVPTGQVGEVACRSPQTSEEYYKNPEKTRECLKDGWFRTGDLGRFDEEGYLYLVDRKKDVINTGGENVYAQQVEDILFAYPKIMEAAVIGLPHPVWGEQVTAVVRLKEGEKLSEAELIAHCKESLASYKCPKQVIFWDTPLPRTSFGKVLKRELRAMYRGKV